MISLVFILVAATDVVVVDRCGDADRVIVAMDAVPEALGAEHKALAQEAATTLDASALKSCADDAKCLVRVLAAHDLYAIVFVADDSVAVISRKLRTLTRTNALAEQDIARAMAAAARGEAIAPPVVEAPVVEEPVSVEPVVPPPTSPLMAPWIVAGGGALLGLTGGVMFGVFEVLATDALNNHSADSPLVAYETLEIVGIAALVVGAGATIGGIAWAFAGE